MKKVVLCVPTLSKPFQQCLDSIKNSLLHLDKAGWDHYMVSEVGCPYISAARSYMLRRALDIMPDAIVFIDHDLSWAPDNLLRLIKTDGDYVAGTYRYKKPEIEYMGALIPGEDGKPQVRDDGTLVAHCAPAGFMKITPSMVNQFMSAYPGLMYGDRYRPHVDLFNHGAHQWVWYGEDYACSRNWRDAGGEVRIVPDLDITHHSKDESFPGNFHQFLLRQPGGSHEGEQ